ncbi:MAG: tyrosine-protein phosphatase [Ferrimicrobium sp.]
MMGELDPRIQLQGPLNFRDLGGYPTITERRVRLGLVYRADNLAQLTSSDIDRLGGLGLRTVIDLRSSEEVDRLGRFPVDEYPSPLTYAHLSLVEDVVGVRSPGVDDQTYINTRYLHLLERGADAIVASFHLFALPTSYPLVFHCVAGKDRTGLIAALLLDLLGVPDESIARDYQLTDRATKAWFDRMRSTQPQELEVIQQIPAVLFSSNPETILAVLERIRSSAGSIEEWLRAHGIADDEIDSIRNLLLTEQEEQPYR